MRSTFLFGLLVASICALSSHPVNAAPTSAEQLSILGVPPNHNLIFTIGTAWNVFLDGVIDPDAPQRLEGYIERNHIPTGSMVVINSPGGNLYAGMELGRIIRKHGFRTNVGKKTADANGGYEAGVCYSACTLTYVGGTFRFFEKGSVYGVHRFAFTRPIDRMADISQIASAEIVSYLTTIGIDPELFTQFTKAGPHDINSLTLDSLIKLNVVTYGFGKTKWSIESLENTLYLKGERNTTFGINKFMLLCPQRPKIELYVIFDPQGRQDEVMRMNAYSLMIDEKPYPIKPLSKSIKNGWFNASFEIKPILLKAIHKAKTVGLIAQFTYGAPVFLGFDAMPLKDGTGKLSGFYGACGN